MKTGNSKKLNPKKHFGFLPTRNFMVFTIVSIIIAANALRLLWDSFTSESLDRSTILATGMLLGAVFFMLLILTMLRRSIVAKFHMSRRERYTMKHLRPFLNSKYGIDIDPKSCAELPETNRVEIRGREGDFLFFGWDEIEDVAKGKNVNLEESLYVLKEEEDRAFELEPVGFTEGDERVSFTRKNPENDNIPLVMTEDGVRDLVFEIMAALPNGKTIIGAVGEEILGSPGLESKIEVIVENDVISYSQKKLKELIEASVFNIRLGGSSCIMVTVITGDKVYMLSKIILPNGFRIVNANELTRLLGEDENVTYIESLEALKQ